MHIAALGIRLIATRVRRILLFVCLMTLLCVTAGAVGNYLLYAERVADPVTLVFVDEDDTVETRLFFDVIGRAVGRDDLLLFHKADAGEAMEMLENGQAGAVFTIPPGFTQSVLVGENDPFLIAVGEDATLVTSLVQLFVDAYTDMLRAGQIGVFSALDIAYEQGGGEAYNTMFRAANLRYLGAMLNRGRMQQVVEVSATGQTSIPVYYGAVAYVFLNLLGAVLFLDVLGRAASRPVLLRLRMLGRGGARCAAGYLAAAAAPFTLIGALSLAGLLVALRALGIVFALSLPLLAAALAVALCAGAFTLAVALLLRGEAAGGVFVTVYSLLCLFLSGGVLPVAYFSEPLRLASRFTPHYWLVRLLTEALAGAVAPETWLGAGVFWAVCAALCLLGAGLRGRVGAKP